MVKQCYKLVQILKILKNVIKMLHTMMKVFRTPIGKEAGGLFYVACQAPQFTIISIDSARYSKDNTDACKDDHEANGI